MASQLLLHAVNQADMQQCQSLIVEGCADVNHQNSLGESPIHVAAIRGLPAVLELLLGFGGDPNVARHEEFGGDTPLHIAADKGHLRIAEILLCNSADPNIQNSLGMIPLHVAARCGNEEMVLLLLSHGTKPEVLDCLGKTAYYYAAERDYVGVMRLLPVQNFDWREAREKEISRYH
eukprot:Sspe_Gene.41298::Locus_19972_Transcript_1_1_Confidence_1.000_Length_576::g.41298::m.41298